MSVSRRCTECGNEIPEGSRAKTCSARCRSRKSRRVQAAKAVAGATPAGGQRPENEVYEAEQHELARKVMSAELAPYVREQITDDVVKAIGGMLQLTPKVVAVLELDLLHPDPQIRMKAAGLIAKYSMPEKFMPADVGGDNTLNVEVSVPTPQGYTDAKPDPVQLAPDQGDNALRQCNRCGEHKEESHFDAGAPRCNECQAIIRAELMP